MGPLPFLKCPRFLSTSLVLEGEEAAFRRCEGIYVNGNTKPCLEPGLCSHPAAVFSSSQDGSMPVADQRTRPQSLSGAGSSGRVCRGARWPGNTAGAPPVRTGTPVPLELVRFHACGHAGVRPCLKRKSKNRSFLEFNDGHRAIRSTFSNSVLLHILR